MIDPRRAAIDRPEDHLAMEQLYRRAIDAWNRRDAATLVRCFDEEGELIVGDGRAARGREAVRALLDTVLREPGVPTYAPDAIHTRKISFHAGILRARAVVESGGLATQSLVACSEYDEWLIELLHVTPEVS